MQFDTTNKCNDFKQFKPIRVDWIENRFGNNSFEN